MKKKLPQDWKLSSIADTCEILDRKRVPLNAKVRRDMKGVYPYYGANGQVDLINDWIFDTPIILLAEDGGNFHDFSNRPIAYKVNGKCWVNNHAHVLKPNIENDFDWVFYQLEHKNIIPFINGSTRRVNNYL